MSIEILGVTTEVEMTEEQWGVIDSLVDTGAFSYDDAKRWVVGVASGGRGVDFDKRNDYIVAAADVVGLLRKRNGWLAGGMSESEYYHDIGGERRRAERGIGNLRESMARNAARACDVCPLRQGCEIAGELGSKLLNGEVDYKALRTAVSLTPTGKERPGYKKGCVDNGGAEKAS